MIAAELLQIELMFPGFSMACLQENSYKLRKYAYLNLDLLRVLIRKLRWHSSCGNTANADDALRKKILDLITEEKSKC